ncbi:MAG: hypothetical protein JJU35_03555, partial [Balneolales bacterium]|nr:hypothetical protein [Balneolales bacterium]
QEKKALSETGCRAQHGCWSESAFFDAAGSEGRRPKPHKITGQPDSLWGRGFGSIFRGYRYIPSSGAGIERTPGNNYLSGFCRQPAESPNSRAW